MYGVRPAASNPVAWIWVRASPGDPYVPPYRRHSRRVYPYPCQQGPGSDAPSVRGQVAESPPRRLSDDPTGTGFDAMQLRAKPLSSGSRTGVLPDVCAPGRFPRSRLPALPRWWCRLPLPGPRPAVEGTKQGRAASFWPSRRHSFPWALQRCRARRRHFPSGHA